MQAYRLSHREGRRLMNKLGGVTLLLAKETYRETSRPRYEESSAVTVEYGNRKPQGEERQALVLAGLDPDDVIVLTRLTYLEGGRVTIIMRVYEYSDQLEKFLKANLY